MKKAHSSHSSKGVEELRPAKAHHRLRTLGIVVLVIAVLTGVGRLMLPSLIRDYVNRTLDKNQLYSGRIGDVQVHLWWGAYSIHDVKLSKVPGNVPVPLFAGRPLPVLVHVSATDPRSPRMRFQNVMASCSLLVLRTLI